MGGTYETMPCKVCEQFLTWVVPSWCPTIHVFNGDDHPWSFQHPLQFSYYMSQLLFGKDVLLQYTSKYTENGIKVGLWKRQGFAIIDLIDDVRPSIILHS